MARQVVSYTRDSTKVWMIAAIAAVGILSAILIGSFYFEVTNGKF